MYIKGLTPRRVTHGKGAVLLFLVLLCCRYCVWEWKGSADSTGGWRVGGGGVNSCSECSEAATVCRECADCQRPQTAVHMVTVGRDCSYMVTVGRDCSSIMTVGRDCSYMVTVGQ